LVTKGLREFRTPLLSLKKSVPRSRCAGLGEDLDASEAEAVVLGREGVLVDADLSDRFFGRQVAAAESVNEDLAAVGPCGGPGQGLKGIGEIVRIIRQRSEVVAFQHQGGGVVIGLDADAGACVGGNGHLLFLGGHPHLDRQLEGAGSDGHLFLEDREARNGRADGVLARRDAAKRI
jgi:hypothetical protein